MPPEYEIVLRHSSAGWLGILITGDVEKYRTGIHKSSPVAALTAVQFWIQQHEREL